MSENDGLDKLDNTALHKLCLEHGMPNIPVTDSSRKVLLKRLKAIMSDPAAAAEAKKTNRRETIHSTRPMTPSKQTEGAAAGAAAEERRTPGRPRRTIAVSSNVEDKLDAAEQPASITGRRRSTAQNTMNEKEAANEPAPTAAAKDRRRSVRGDSQSKISPTSNVVASERPQTISEDDEYMSPTQQQQQQRPGQRRAGSAMLELAQQYNAAGKAKQTSPYLRDGSIVILESEDEDDDDLLRAVEQAEQQTKAKVTPSRTSRAGSQSQTSSFGYRQQGATAGSGSIFLTQPQLQKEPQQKPVDYGFVRPLSGSMSSNIRSSISATQPVVSSGGAAAVSQMQSSRQALDYSSTRYSSSVLPPLVSTSYTSSLPSRYSTSSITTSSVSRSSAAAYKPSSYVLNEQSDDAAGEASGDDLNTPFLSSFARNLERIKTEGIASNIGSPRYRGSRTTANYGQSYSQSVRAAGASFWQRMNRKYHLRLIIILMILIMVLAFFYVLFFN